MTILQTDIDKIDITLRILALLVSLGTFIIGWKIMKRFHRQHISVKQLDKVTELIDFINNKKINFLFGISGGNAFGGTPFNMSLFELKSMEFDDSPFLNSDIYLSEKTKRIIDFSNFINNPLIPVEISEELKNFLSWKGDAIYLSNISENLDENNEKLAVIIESDKEGDCHIFNKEKDEVPQYIDYKAFCCTDWNNFKECSKSLENEIRLWLAKYNVNEIKIIE